MSAFLQVLKFIWAFPVTFVGILKTLFIDGFWNIRAIYWSKGRKCWHVEVKYLRLVPKNVAAHTFGHWVSMKPGIPVVAAHHLFQHEHRHVTQCERFGPLLLIAYPLASLIVWFTGGDYYRDNFFEADARKNCKNEKL